MSPKKCSSKCSPPACITSPAGELPARNSSAGSLPLVPGSDGVGRGADGKLRYFAQSPGQIGTMADKTVIELAHSIELPSDSDPVTVAGAMNPAMAS